MNNILSKTIKCIEKKIKLKNYLFSTVLSLKSAILEDHFPKDYISKNGNTLYDFDRVISRMDTCNTSIVYKTHDKADTQNDLVYQAYDMIDSNACNNHTLCPVCASKKRSRILYQINPYIKSLLKMDAYFYMITATIPNYHVDQLGDAYDYLRNAWTDFVKKGQKRKDGMRSNGEANKFYGSVMSIEIIPAKEKTDYFHVHAHILVAARRKLDYSIITKEKRKELKEMYGYGYGAIPQHEFIKNAKSFITDKNGDRVHDLSGFDIPASKITQEWYDCSGAVNFRVDSIKDGPVYSKKRNKWEHKTVEQQIPEVIKYESKPWEFKNSVNLFKAWDAVSGKRRITKAGIFTKRNKNHWKKLLKYHKLTNYFNEFNIDSDNIVSESEIVPFIWDEKGNDYTVYEKSFAKTIYQYPGLVKTSRQLRAKVLNWYMSEFHKLKKQIGKIENREWIDKKKSLQLWVTELNKYINTELIVSCMKYKGSMPIIKSIFEHLGIEQRVFNMKIEPFQDNLFKDIEGEIIANRKEFIKDHHKINLVIDEGIDKRILDTVKNGSDKPLPRIEPLRPYDIDNIKIWQVAKSTSILHNEHENSFSEGEF